MPRTGQEWTYTESGRLPDSRHSRQGGRAYFSGEEILKCVQTEVTPLVPQPLTSNSKTEGRFDKRDSHCDPKRDRYLAGEFATRRFTSIEMGMTIHKYWSSVCPGCPIRSACSTSDHRRLQSCDLGAGDTADESVVHERVTGV